jgi:hypothetical protein
LGRADNDGSTLGHKNGGRSINATDKTGLRDFPHVWSALSTTDDTSRSRRNTSSQAVVRAWKYYWCESSATINYLWHMHGDTIRTRDVRVDREFEE